MKRVKEKRLLLFIMSSAILLLACITVYLAVQLQQKGTEISWEIYDSKTDLLFQELAKQYPSEKEGRIITGVIGIPWAEYPDDMIEDNSEMPSKRVLQVHLGDGNVDAFVVAYYAPYINNMGFAGVFRQYPTDDNIRMLSSSTSYVPGIIISTFAFPAGNEEIDMNVFVEKELELTAKIQTILEDDN